MINVKMPSGLEVDTETVDEFAAVMLIIGGSAGAKPIPSSPEDAAQAGLKEEPIPSSPEDAAQAGLKEEPIPSSPEDAAQEVETPETTVVDLSERDPSGLPWDARIHIKAQKRNKTDNNWTLQRRSPDKKPEFDLLVAQVRAEYALPTSETAVVPGPPTSETAVVPGPPTSETAVVPGPPTAGTDPTLDPAAWFKHVNQTNDGVSRFARISTDCPAAQGVKTVVEFTKLDKPNRDSLWAWIQADVDAFRAQCQAQEAAVNA